MKKIFILSACFLFLVGISGIMLLNPDQADADVNTILMDHFDGTTSGIPYGTFSYESSVFGLGQAPNFQSDGAYIKYSNIGTSVGTIELWIKPTQYGPIINGNWNNVSSNPPSGHVVYFNLNPEGKLSFSQWGGSGSGVTGNTTVPLNDWSYVAVSFGPTYAALYLNGEQDNIAYGDHRPSWSSGNYLYLSNWGESSAMKGMMDELHVSNIQRTDEEIAAYYASVIPEPISSTLFLVGGATLGFRRFRKKFKK